MNEDKSGMNVDKYKLHLLLPGLNQLLTKAKKNWIWHKLPTSSGPNRW